MPNGFHGDKEAWEAAEAPLKRLDLELVEYASDHKMDLELNGRRKNWPMRSLAWSRPATIRRNIVLSLDSDQKAYSLEVFAVTRAGGPPRRRRSTVFESKPEDWFSPRFMGYLNQARDLVESWDKKDLKVF